jgi:predicted RNA-binding protein YlqC (UPF0109 family)
LGTDTDALTAVREAEQAIEEMLLFVARSLADHPDDVEVEFLSAEDGDVFQIQAHEEDLGRLIGKNGQTARALEAIVNASRRRSGRRYHLDIIGIDEALDEQ